MVALVSLLVIIVLSMIVVRTGAVALAMTGVSMDLAALQAQSAFSGVGFTTSEAESVVNHPVRRRIIRVLMLLGNAGLTSAAAGLILTFYQGSGRQMAVRGGVIVGGLALFWLVAKSKYAERMLTRIIESALGTFTEIRISDYTGLLELEKGYAVSEIDVTGKEDWLCGRTLQDLALTNEGVLVLGVRRRDGAYVGVPHGDTKVECGDTLICYGRGDQLRSLAGREAGREGDLEHAAEVEEQVRIDRRASE
jgi:hypothetical protein